jgi:hypothetical protein
MISEPELVALLYRADWTKLTLAGTVTGTEPVVQGAVTVQPDAPPGGEGSEIKLFVAPGRRFRADGADGAWATGSDGTRMWRWFRLPPAGASVELAYSGPVLPRAPYRTLLVPSWLLSGYSLEIDGAETVGGRPGVRVLGTPRPVTKPASRFGRLGQQAGGGLFAPRARWLRLDHHDAVEAVVDAELGILLRCAKRSRDQPPAVSAFTALAVAAPVDDSLFSAPPGSMFGGADAPRGQGERTAGETAGGSLGDALGGALETAGKEAAKAVAGLAAGGLGALIKFAPQARVDAFTQATAETDPEAAMPADERPPDEQEPGAAPVPDEVLHLLYRSGLAVPPLRATLHQWADLDPVLAAVPPSARGAGFGGVGFLLDALRDVTREERTGPRHAVSTVSMRGWLEYRIDLVQSMGAARLPGRGRDRDQAQTIVTDGERQWQVHSDRVMTGPAAPPTSDLADLVDASWLLDRDLDLSGGTEVWAGGRRAYRIVARYRDVAGLGLGWWQRLFFPAVAVVDAETRVLLRLTRFKGARPTLRQELRDVAALAPGADFGFTPPDGMPVRDADSPSADGQPGSRSWSWGPPQ